MKNVPLGRNDDADDWPWPYLNSAWGRNFPFFSGQLAEICLCRQLHLVCAVDGSLGWEFGRENPIREGN